LLLAALLLVNAANNHLSLVLVSVVQGNAVNCNSSHHYHEEVRHQGERQTNVNTSATYWDKDTWVTNRSHYSNRVMRGGTVE